MKKKTAKNLLRKNFLDKTKILAIETSCDETAIALVEASGGLSAPKFKILENFVASQIKIHRPFGGVVPNLAKREHLKNLPVLLGKIFSKSQIANSKLKNVDLIAVTVGPGLEPALWTGINFAQELHKELINLRTYKLKTKLVGVSHLDGHLYSFLLKTNSYKLKASQIFPAIALIISGGHTILLKMDSLAKYKKLGETVDDAVGEAFDKVARLLDLPYPGGPEIERLALRLPKGEKLIPFPRPMLNQKNYNFSFSGLKTSVLYYLRSKEQETRNKEKADIAASFQAAAFDVLIKKTLRAAEEFGAKSIMVSGGVASNNSLHNYFKSKVKSQKLKVNFFVPSKKFTTDNAAMIAAAAYVNQLRKKKYKLVANGNLGI